MTSNATGLRYAERPLRVYDYEAVCGAANQTVEYPKYFILPKEKMGIVKDQGSVNSCVAEVISSLAEVFENMENGGDTEFSEGYAYGMFRDDGDNFMGMFIIDALDYWRKLGIVPKTYFGELEEMPEMRKKALKYPGLGKIAQRYKIQSYVALSGGREKKDLQIKEAITTHGYGLLCDSREYFGSPHCIMLVGWNDDTDSYIIKNSWGESYGNKGIKEIPKKEINNVYLILDEVIKMKFEDVKEGEWFYDSVKNVTASGLMQGVSDTLFEPNKTMTRAEAAAVFDRMAKSIDERITLISKMLADKKDK